MISESRKRQIREHVRNGRELPLVYDLLEVTVDEQAEIDTDEEFQNLLAYDRAAYQNELEAVIQGVISIEASKGNGATLRWYYDRKYGSTTETDKPRKPHFPFEAEDTEELRKKAKVKGRFLE